MRKTKKKITDKERLDFVLHCFMECNEHGFHFCNRQEIDNEMESYNKTGKLSWPTDDELTAGLEVHRYWCSTRTGQQNCCDFGYNRNERLKKSK